MPGIIAAALGICRDDSRVENADERNNMKTLKQCLAMLMLLAVGSLVGCSGASKQSPDVSDNIRKSLDQAGLKSVSVTQDRDKGVVTLSGNVASDGDEAGAVRGTWSPYLEQPSKRDTSLRIAPLRMGE